MNTFNLRYNFIDICTPDYLTDHHSKRSGEGDRREHNREGEQLIAVDYYDGITRRDLAQEVAGEVLHGSDYPELWAELPNDDEAARVLIEQLVLDEVADWQLAFEATDGDDIWAVDESDVMVYGYFSWGA
jgi:hypothetical protein